MANPDAVAVAVGQTSISLSRTHRHAPPLDVLDLTMTALEWIAFTGATADSSLRGWLSADLARSCHATIRGTVWRHGQGAAVAATFDIAAGFAVLEFSRRLPAGERRRPARLVDMARRWAAADCSLFTLGQL